MASVEVGLAITLWWVGATELAGEGSLPAAATTPHHWNS